MHGNFLRSLWTSAAWLCCFLGACSDSTHSPAVARSTGSAPNEVRTSIANPASGSDRAEPSTPQPTGAALAEPPPIEAAVPVAASAEPADGARLYAQHCAPCHGISGDGNGQLKLDPPARSFQAGKFSFGNTPEQLFKTITAGIPGRSPMPAFDLVLSEDERRAIVEHLKSLMPVEESTSVERTEMIVLGKPVFARGLMRPITSGAPTRERALLLGRPEGLSFEYRIDDVRLLGVRLGRFAVRRDWGGRGGDALEALGRVIALMQNGDPDATFRSADAAVKAHFRGSWARGDESLLEMELETANAQRVGRLEERLEVVALREGTGFERSWKGPATRVASLRFDPLGVRDDADMWKEHAGWWWHHFALEDGTTLVTAVKAGTREIAADGRVLFAAAAGADASAWRCVTLIASAWDDARRSLVAEALTR